MRGDGAGGDGAVLRFSADGAAALAGGATTGRVGVRDALRASGVSANHAGDRAAAGHAAAPG